MEVSLDLNVMFIFIFLCTLIYFAFVQLVIPFFSIPLFKMAPLSGEEFTTYNSFDVGSSAGNDVAVSSQLLLNDDGILFTLVNNMVR